MSSQEQIQNPARANCFVTVRSIRKSGEVHKKVFSIYTSSQAACDAYAQPHRANYAPQVITRINVISEWKK